MILILFGLTIVGLAILGMLQSNLVYDLENEILKLMKENDELSRRLGNLSERNQQNAKRFNANQEST